MFLEINLRKVYTSLHRPIKKNIFLMGNLLEIVFQMVPIGHAFLFDVVIVPTLEHIV